ncbi:MAG: serine/threonine protein phosphatase [Verrucomicrobiales bacterium]|nr:serine/threonine protein phosphatase [Verrucomicrobiales bacterium]|tara:strand:- start:1578 stop:4916 length:3339 start_codon:yes stop_codon:yes gene_type:complete
MARASKKKSTRKLRYSASTAKYDAHHNVLSDTYGNLADLRRSLSDSKADVDERGKILGLFSVCNDSQRAWLLLEDYFDKLKLSRKDFPGEDWWDRLMDSENGERLEELSMVFLRANRNVPSELLPHTNFDRFAEIEEAEREERMLRELEEWLFPPAPAHLDSPRASLRVICRTVPQENNAALHKVRIEFHLRRPRTGEKVRTLEELLDLNTRAAHEQELFPKRDWDFISWIVENYGDQAENIEAIELSGLELLQWLAQWGQHNRLELNDTQQPLRFEGNIAQVEPNIETGKGELSFTHTIKLPNGEKADVNKAIWFGGQPALLLLENTIHIVRNAPPETVVQTLTAQPKVPVQNLSHRFITHLRRSNQAKGINWDELCTSHPARPQFVFELVEDTVRLRLVATSDRDKSTWQWSGHEWKKEEGTGRSKKKKVAKKKKNGRPEILDDVRLEAAVAWLRQLDWFTPEPGLWVGDANENFLNVLARVWNDRPAEADYLGNGLFQRLFLNPKRLKPNLVVKGSGINWLSVSAEWEEEGMRLTKKDLDRLAKATSRFVKLPNAGWVELDTDAVQKAQETMADLGIDGLSSITQKVGIEQAAHLEEDDFQKFVDTPAARKLRDRLKEYEGVKPTGLPEVINADLRPYQKQGFDFLCHLTQLNLGGVLADDMGLGKTLQTLSWLSWLKVNKGKKYRPSLVICPASVLHNWRREAEKFTPNLKVLVLQSGSARRNLLKQIPKFDLVVTNYALLRRDLEQLQKFSFGALVLDEAQFIKNPQAQVTQSVKQLNADHRLALTGTPLENRLLDLWSIVDFTQPGYLGNQEHFNETYDPKPGLAPGESRQSAEADSLSLGRIARRKLGSKLRPVLKRRVKQQVAKDLPDRIEQRRDCILGEEQRKLYLAELRRSRDQVLEAVKKKGLAKSKMHVLAALTRLRQICCHPSLVGSSSPSGKTETLFELLEPLLEENQKILVFSQFVKMLQLLEKDCGTRGIPTHMLTGETKDRQEVVNTFQEDERGGVFLLSLRAAGTGLNLTTASFVVLYDPWWNPAVEAQAIDRSHRIGQTQTVNAYKLITPGTVEEKIWDLQQRKSQTIADVLGEEGFAKSLSETDLEYLFSED